MLCVVGAQIIFKCCCNLLNLFLLSLLTQQPCLQTQNVFLLTAGDFLSETQCSVEIALGRLVKPFGITKFHLI